jgi:hypothetical protein
MIVSQSLLDRVNQQAVNQHANRLLLKAGQRPDPSQVALLQLLAWGVESGEVPVLDQHPSLLDNLAVLLGAHPQEALDFLLKQGREDLVSEEEVLQENDPAHLAAFLAQVLALKLQQASPP